METFKFKWFCPWWVFVYVTDKWRNNFQPIHLAYFQPKLQQEWNLAKWCVLIPETCTPSKRQQQSQWITINAVKIGNWLRTASRSTPKQLSRDFWSFLLANNDIYCQELQRLSAIHLLHWVSPGYFWLDSLSSRTTDLCCPLKFSYCITFPCAAFVTQLFFQPRFICESHRGLAVIRAQKPLLCFWIVLANSVLIEDWYSPGDQSLLFPMTAQASPQDTFGLTQR